MHDYNISVVMPAFNVEKYIGEAIESILNQSYTNWELIIVDDCSTDNTVNIVNNYVSKHPQIRLLKRAQNSGGCRLPRFDGILAAKGKFVCPVDSDDLWEKDYLLKLYNRQQETNSTLVLGRMIISDENGKPLNQMIPSIDYNFETIESGKEACKRTIGKWDIALAGLLAKTNYYHTYIQQQYNKKCNFGFADEIDHRQLLYNAEKVAYANAHYFYRQQPNSIVHNISAKRFDIIKAYQLLDNFVFTKYPKNTDIQNRFCLDFLKVLYYNYSAFYTFKKRATQEQRQSIQRLLHQAYSTLKQHNITATATKEKLLLNNFFTFRLIAYIQNIYTRIK